MFKNLLVFFVKINIFPIKNEKSDDIHFLCATTNILYTYWINKKPKVLSITIRSNP